jgi:phospholipid-binding lipoprotein MlaA
VILSRLRSSQFALLTGLMLMTSAAAFADSDPWEPVNSRIFTFNSHMDRWILRPIASTYNRVLPHPVRLGIENFFLNINDVNVMANNLLQLKMRDAASDSGRILLNTTVGLAGFIDVASKAGLERHQEDFGQTLGYWGVGSGPYVVLPFFGPSNVRDSFGFGVDSYVNPVRTIDDRSTRDVVLTLHQIDTRARAIQLEGMMFGDQYLFIREAYLQQRQYLVNDGQVRDDFDDEFADDF